AGRRVSLCVLCETRRDDRREHELLVSPASTASCHFYRGLTARHDARRTRCAGCTLERSAKMRYGCDPRLADDRILDVNHVIAARAGFTFRARHRVVTAANDGCFGPSEPRIVRFRRLGALATHPGL